MLKNFSKNINGQGLLEAITAIGIIVIGVLGAMALVMSNVDASRASSLRIIASGLSWEGIEVVRNTRDSNWLDPLKIWSDDILSFSGDQTLIPVFDDLANTWSLDFTPDNIISDEARVYRKGRVYVQALSLPVGGAVTPFYRLVKTIEIKDVGNNVIGLKVISEVRWLERNSWKNVKSEEWLYNWR